MLKVGLLENVEDARQHSWKTARPHPVGREARRLPSYVLAARP
jgi:hypothetical protein